MTVCNCGDALESVIDGNYLEFLTVKYMQHAGIILVLLSFHFLSLLLVIHFLWGYFIDVFINSFS